MLLQWAAALELAPLVRLVLSRRLAAAARGAARAATAARDAARQLYGDHGAAALGHVSCVWAIGNAYSKGEGVALDFATASRWLKRGTRLGDGQSAFSLAQLPPPHGEGL